MRFIVVNRTHELAGWSDALYCADSGFWMVHARARAFPGLQFAPDPQCKLHSSRVHVIPILKQDGHRVNTMQPYGADHIGSGGHSGFQAINLAVLAGAKQIYLAGFDYVADHWHPPHGRLLRNPDGNRIRQWRDCLDSQSLIFRGWGVQITNLSPSSTLRKYDHEDCRAVRARLAALSGASV